MKITVVVDNMVDPGNTQPLLGQHGLAMLLDIPDCGRILFDTGQSDVLMKNLLLLDIMPDSIDYTILSHGHEDHCGGLLPFLRARRMPVTVFAGPGLFSPRYLQDINGQTRFIGVSYTKETLTSSGADFIFTYGPAQIRENIWLSGPIPKVTEFESENLSMVDTNSQTDRFPDEIAVYITTPEGVVILTGCSHRGLVNIIKYGQKVTGMQKVHAIIGGSDLGRVGDWQKESTIDFLAELDPNIIALNHCTGIKMLSFLQNFFGSKIVEASTGKIIEL